MAIDIVGVVPYFFEGDGSAFNPPVYSIIGWYEKVA